MRIAMVGPFGFHPKKTMRSRALPLARALANRGHRVKLLMPPWHTPEMADRDWFEDGVEIRYIPLGGGILRRSWRLVTETIAWEPDVVHAFKPKAYSGLTAWWLWQFHRRNLTIITDTDDWEGWGGWNELSPYSGLQKRFFSWQEGWGLKHNHGLTVASRALESLAWARGITSDRVHYLPNGPGIHPQSGSEQENSLEANSAVRAAHGLDDRPLVLIYSRWFEYDSERLIAVLQRACQMVPELGVLIVGTSLNEADAAAFRSRAADLELDKVIVDLGWVEEEDLPAALAAADTGLFLMDDNLLNRTKCPVKLADMLSVGVPVVAESVGQVPEYVVHDRTGLLYESGDVEGLADGLSRLLQDRDERNRLSRGARDHIGEHFNWDVLAEKLLTIYSR